MLSGVPCYPSHHTAVTQCEQGSPGPFFTISHEAQEEVAGSVMQQE